MKEKKILFLCGLFPKEKIKEVEQFSKGVIQYAADALQWSFVNGMIANHLNIDVLTLPFIGSYPKRFKKLTIKPYNFFIKGINSGICPGFNNFTGYKLFSRYLSAKKEILNWAKSTEGEKIILIYAIHTPFIKAAVEAKKINSKIKICLIVPDLPEFMSHSSSLIRNTLKNLEGKLLENLLPQIDSFVVLTSFMVEKLKIQQKPWVCIEGIYNSSNELNFEEETKRENKTILYTGTLSSQYGILNLLNSFKEIEDPNYQLWICGEGNTRKIIEAQAERDKRIIYFGQISQEDVLKLQRRATVLINPRTSDGEFTKYSFPSKTMEYLASGRPVIIHKLPGIPEEYFEYCFWEEKETISGLKEKIVSICSMEEEKLAEFGKRARAFILENKNPKVQVEKMVKSLF